MAHQTPSQLGHFVITPDLEAFTAFESEIPSFDLRLKVGIWPAAAIEFRDDCLVNIKRQIRASCRVPAFAFCFGGAEPDPA